MKTKIFFLFLKKNMKNQKLNISKLSSYEKKQAKQQQPKIKAKKLQ